jgi:hypothetical protein
MKILYKSIAFLFLAFFTANASFPNPSALDNTRMSVYLHPVSILLGANDKTVLFYSTIEIPLNLYIAPIIKPSFWSGKDIFRIGSDLGFRHYLAGRGEGLYLQLKGGAFYFSAKNWNFDSDSKNNDEIKRSKGTWFDGMAYLGQAYKFRYISIYYDYGIGYGCALGSCALIPDGNIGLGISF